MPIAERPHSRYLRLVLPLFLLCTGVVSSGEPDPATSPGLGSLSRHTAPTLSDLSPLQEGETDMAQSRWWSRFYGAGLYDTRWEGWFIQSFFQQGYDLMPDRVLSLYGIGWLTADTRSTGAGPAPTIISDNVLILGVGLRYRPSRFFWIDAQEGIGIDLIERSGMSTTRNDFRLVATGGTGIYPEFRVHDDLQAPLTLMADCFGSSGYYSRYENMITYLQGRLGLRAGEVSRMFLDVYLRGDAVFDTDGEFYNNLFEIGPGLRFTPDPEWGLFLMVEYRRGFYADYTEVMSQTRALYYPAQYNAVRFIVVLDREF